jgi:predicted NBD/HSP70 family sugar kinase
MSGQTFADGAGPVVSVDLRGTNTRVAVVDASGEILRRQVQPTAPMDEHPDRLVELVTPVAGDSGAGHAVIGGGMGLTGDLLYGPIRATLGAFGPRDLPQPIRIARAELGDDAGLVGAAGWTRTFDPTPAPEATPA